LNSTLNRVETCAIIPFFNEEKTIEEIIKKTLEYVDCIIAVDDGSDDKSASKISNNKDIILLKNIVNRGKGFSLSTGFKKSIELNSVYTITLDADLQHPPEYIPKILDKLKENDLVIGNRLNDLNNMPFQRILSNKLTSGLLTLKTRKKIPDSQCGFRGYRTKILSSIIPKSSGFEAESEIIVKAARNNYKIDFVSIPTIYGEEKSKMRAVQAITGFIKVLFIK
jgi:glycosyltransferase involved in cell wall biosynthesis